MHMITRQWWSHCCLETFLTQVISAQLSPFHEWLMLPRLLWFETLVEWNVRSYIPALHIRMILLDDWCFQVPLDRVKQIRDEMRKDLQPTSTFRIVTLPSHWTSSLRALSTRGNNPLCLRRTNERYDLQFFTSSSLWGWRTSSSTMIFSIGRTQLRDPSARYCSHYIIPAFNFNLRAHSEC